MFKFIARLLCVLITLQSCVASNLQQEFGDGQSQPQRVAASTETVFLIDQEDREDEELKRKFAKDEERCCCASDCCDNCCYKCARCWNDRTCGGNPECSRACDRLLYLALIGSFCFLFVVILSGALSGK